MDVLFLFHFRLRGFYGIVHVDKEETEIVLTEARSGEEQMRWKISSVNRVFCPKTVCKRDKNKILVIITKRSVMSIASWSLSSYCQAQCPVIVTEPSMTILMNARVSQPSYPPFPNQKHKISNVSKLKLLVLKSHSFGSTKKHSVSRSSFGIPTIKQNTFWRCEETGRFVNIDITPSAPIGINPCFEESAKRTFNDNLFQCLPKIIISM